MKVIDENNSIKYILSLKTKTRRAQFKEIISQSEFLYPVKFSKEQLYFFKFSKNQTITYIVKQKQKANKLLSPTLYEKNHKKQYSQNINRAKRKDFVFQYRKRDYTIRTVLIILVVIVSVISYLVFTGELERINRARIERAALESQEARRIALEKKELIKKAETLEKEYNTLLSKVKRNIWRSIAILTSAIDGSTSIDEIAINDNSFLLYIRSDNPLEILSALERNPEIKEVSLEKLSREGISESATIRGVFSTLKTEYTLSDNPKDKINYLEEKIKEKNKKDEESKWQSSSTFLAELKSSLEAKECIVKSFASRNTESSVVADITAESSISSIFSFLKEKSDVFLIQSLRIRRRSTSVQADIKIMGELKKIEKMQDDKSPVITTDATKLFSNNKKDDSKKQESVIRKTTQFSFVGRARKDGTTYCVFKDEKSGKIHRLVLAENADKNGTCSVIENSRYLINIDNEKYEVGR